MICNLAALETLFAKMQRDGIDPSQPLRYGYFFFHTEKAPLEAAAAWLAERDYVIVDLSDRDDGSWVMQLSKTEQHTSESLHRRNENMNRLAEEFGIQLYDGWDAGPV